VYCTSTTGFNIRFIRIREIASKALPLRSLIVSALALPARTLATQLEHMRPISTSLINFLAPLHLFCASICFTASPYTYLDAPPHNMLRVLRCALCCIVSLSCLHNFFRISELKVSNPAAAALSLLWSNTAGI
jgi:hypothetical protein